MTLRFRSFLVFSVLFLTATFAMAQKPAEKPTPPADKKPMPEVVSTDPSVKSGIKRDDDGHIIFPDVDGFEKDDPYVYPGRGAGYSINYNSASSRVTVYEYDLGDKNISNELNRAIDDQVDAAKEAIRGAAEAGIYKNLKESKTETVMLGGEKGKVKVRRAQFQLERNGQKMHSDIYVFPYQNQYIKLRITRSTAASKEDNEAFARLMAALDDLFAL